MSYFLTLGKAADFPDGKMRAFDIGGYEIAVAHVGEKYYAFRNACTHQQEYLTDGFLTRSHQIICAYHEAEFDLASGVVQAGPALYPLPTFPVRIEEDNLQIEWPGEVLQDAIKAVDHSDEDRSTEYVM